MTTRTHNLLAIDLGASNGRVVRGRLAERRLSFEVIHRFEHGPVSKDGCLRWDWPRIAGEIQVGLAAAADAAGSEGIASISCSSWAQDFGLLDRDGRLCYSPVSYRDSRTEGMPGSFASVISPTELVKRVGCGVTPVTALCQLKAMADADRACLERADRLLFVADLVHNILCGSTTTDWTMATASQLRNLHAGRWDRELLGELGIPSHFLPEIVEQPRVIGRIPRHNPIHPGLADVPVVSTAGHDTAVATACVSPLERGTFFLSLGTWAMLGCCTGELEVPADTAERGWVVLGLTGRRWGVFVAGTGLWPIQECRRVWAGQGLTITDDLLTAEAQRAAIRVRIDPSHPRFNAPPNMPAEIVKACREMGQPAPASPGEFARVVYDGLADHYSAGLRELAHVLDLQAKGLQIVGGGSRNLYLCRKIGSVASVRVSAGPAEAAAIGNILLQARVHGLCDEMDQWADMLGDGQSATTQL